MPDSTILIGDARERLRELPEASVHCAITSPPYWGLRVYAWGGDGSCKDGKHEWPSPVPYPTMTCGKCGATTGTLGLEETPELFITHLVELFREVRRVLRPDGTLWLNLGDCYASSPPGNKATGVEKWKTSGLHGHVSETYAKTLDASVSQKRNTVAPGLKPKDLCMIPARVALALQADGWWLRSAIIWHKPNPMPEAVTDRPTTAHEYVFLLTQSARYFYDAEAIKEPISPKTLTVTTCPTKGDGTESAGEKVNTWMQEQGGRYHPSRANRRTVWTIPTESFPGAHFATFPRRLVEPMIKAGTSEKGCCPECGAPWVRVVDKDRKATRPGISGKTAQLKTYLRPSDTMENKYRNSTLAAVVGNRDTGRHVTETRTVGWVPQCECQAHLAKADGVVTIDELNAWRREHPPEPCTVLDPFDGAGTTRLVAKQLGRNGIGIELNPAYARMAEKRIANPEPLPEIVDADGQETFSFKET